MSRAPGTGRETLRDGLPPHLADNPIFDARPETYFVPAWDRIRLDHILPAFEHALARAQENVDAIRNSKARPTFRNTVEALEQAGDLAGYITSIMSALPPGEDPQAHETLQAQVYTKYIDFWNATFGDRVLHGRLDAVIKSPSFRSLSPERKALAQMYGETFTQSGIHLDPARRAEIQALDRRITALGLRSQAHMRKASAAYVMFVADPAKLAGLSPFALAAAAEKAEKQGRPGTWAFGLDRESYTAFMQSAADRGLRRRLWHAYSTQAAHGRHDNRGTIMELTALQQERARLNGYRNVAQETLAYQMANNARKVAGFLNGLRKAARPVAKHELEALRAYAREKDGLRELKPWDIAYYQERLKQDVLGYNEEAIRPYFELETVLQGMFAHMKKVFGVKIEETAGYPGYHPDMRAFRVTNARSGTHMGIIFMDLFDRPDKPPGTAWDAAVLGQGLFQGAVRRPIDMIVAKFVRGTGAEPTLLLHENVLTLFHEMGHAMHNMLSRCRYASFGGTNVKWDFVEFPSQMQENWAWNPAVLRGFARHHETGETMPDALLEKIAESRKFMAGLRTLGMAARGWLDLSWYRARSATIKSVEDFEANVLSGYRVGLGSDDGPLSPRFSHLFGGGYESCYYSYQWAQVMEADIFALFEKKGLYDRALCTAFRRALEKGGSEEPGKLFRTLRGRAPRQGAFLEREGLRSAFNYEAALSAANDNRPGVQPPAAPPAP